MVIFHYQRVGKNFERQAVLPNNVWPAGSNGQGSGSRHWIPRQRRLSWGSLGWAQTSVQNTGAFPASTVSPPLTCLGGGYTYPSEKYEFVSWDDYSQYIYIYGKTHVPNHQSDVFEVKSTIAIHCCRVCARYAGWFFWIRSISLQKPLRTSTHKTCHSGFKLQTNHLGS